MMQGDTRLAYVVMARLMVKVAGDPVGKSSLPSILKCGIIAMGLRFRAWPAR